MVKINVVGFSKLFDALSVVQEVEAGGQVFSS